MFPNLSSGLSLTKVLSGISRSLNIAKEVIPIYENAKPVASKIKTVFKDFKKINITKPNNYNNINKNETKKTTIITSYDSQNNPKFFL